MHEHIIIAHFLTSWLAVEAWYAALSGLIVDGLILLIESFPDNTGVELGGYLLRTLYKKGKKFAQVNENSQ